MAKPVPEPPRWETTTPEFRQRLNETWDGRSPMSPPMEPQQQPLDAPRPGGGAFSLGTAAEASAAAEAVPAPGEYARYTITVSRYADGGRAVLEFSQLTDLRTLFNHVLDRCYDYGWLTEGAVTEPTDLSSHEGER